MERDTSFQTEQFTYIVNTFANIGINILPVNKYDIIFAHYVE